MAGQHGGWGRLWVKAIALQHVLESGIAEGERVEIAVLHVIGKTSYTSIMDTQTNGHYWLKDTPDPRMLLNHM
jgi:hypothetical protein